MSSNGSATSTGPVDYGERWVPQDTKAAMAAIYNTESEASFEEGGQHDAALLAPYVDAGSTVLDLGCGIGRVARYVAPRCKALWAVDASETMLELAARRLAGLDNVRYARCLGTAVEEVPDGSVDLVYSILVLQHLEREDAFQLLRDVVRLLKPGGTAYLTFPNLLSDVYLRSFVTDVDRGQVTNPVRARIYTPQEVERLVPAAGLELRELRPEENIVAVAGRPHS